MARALSQSRAIRAADVGLPYDEAATSSNDSPPRLAESASLPARSTGYVAMYCEELQGLGDEAMSVSSERETEWKEETDEVGACPELFCGTSSLPGGYVCSAGAPCAGFADEAEETDLRDAKEGLRGGRGGAFPFVVLVGDSRLMRRPDFGGGFFGS